MQLDNIKIAFTGKSLACLVISHSLKFWTPMVYTETVASALTSDCNHALSRALKNFDR